METAKSTYEEILDADGGLIDYVGIIEEMMDARQHHDDAREHFPDDIKRSLELDFIAIKGGRLTGQTLAIKELAIEEGDLILTSISPDFCPFRNGPLHADHKALIVTVAHSLRGEIRCNTQVLKAREKAGELIQDFPEGFVPKRIFLDDGSYMMEKFADARTIFRWARARFNAHPLLISIG